jgi:predicted nucleic acid-binding protein
MPYLVDTNILLRFAFRHDPLHPPLGLIERLFPLLPDEPNLYLEWRKIVVQFSVSGVQVHDARLVAAMKTKAVTHILTFNTMDFDRYASEGIISVAPTN